jgi:hypothetical protein
VSIGALIRQMTEAGAPPEAIAIAVDAIEAAQAGDAERRRKRAEQKAKERAVARQSHDSRTTVASTPPKKERVSPTPPLQEKTPPASLRSAPPTPPATPREFLLECLSAESADAVLAHRRAKRCPLTARAAQLLAKGFMSTGDPNAAADMMIERGWQGFKPEWFDNERAGNGNGKGHSRGSIVDAGRKLTERLLASEREQLQAVNSIDNGDPSVRLFHPLGRQRP